MRWLTSESVAHSSTIGEHSPRHRDNYVPPIEWAPYTRISHVYRTEGLEVICRVGVACMSANIRHRHPSHADMYPNIYAICVCACACQCPRKAPSTPMCIICSGGQRNRNPFLMGHMWPIAALCQFLPDCIHSFGRWIMALLVSNKLCLR